MFRVGGCFNIPSPTCYFLSSVFIVSTSSTLIHPYIYNKWSDVKSMSTALAPEMLDFIHCQAIRCNNKKNHFDKSAFPFPCEAVSTSCVKTSPDVVISRMLSIKK